MLQLMLVFVGGLLGSAHCLGMCGGFALMVGAGARGWTANLARQAIYGAGRVFSYGALGALVGYGGLRLADGLQGIVHVQAIIALVAGIFLVVYGLIASGAAARLRRWLPFRRDGALPAHHAGSGGVSCLLGGITGQFLRDRRLSHVFLAGVFTGLLPCGLVYAFLALAASSSAPLDGLATMTAFGLGTMPMMILAGAGASLLSLAGRRRLLTLAAWCVVATGAISLARGVSFLQAAEAPAEASCPLCADMASLPDPESTSRPDLPARPAR